MEDLDGTHSYEYDPLYRLTEVTYPDQETDAYTYDAVGNRVTKDTDDYTYDAADQLTQVGLTPYTYDTNGNLATRFNEGYVWDDENRLDRIRFGGFDPREQLGKECSDFTGDGASNVGDVLSAFANRILNPPNYDPFYDADGDGDIDVGDVINFFGGGQILKTCPRYFQYNGDGLRTEHTLGRFVTDYDWDAAAGLPVVLQERTREIHCVKPPTPCQTVPADLLAETTYVYGLDLISATDESGAQRYYFADGLGSTTLTAEPLPGGGAETQDYKYDVFGALRSGSLQTQPYWEAEAMLFTGEQFDARARHNAGGLYYLRARFYDPEIGRFLSQDPLPGGNLYAYVGNNPVNFTDPSGLHCKAWHPHHCAKEKVIDPVVDTVSQGVNAFTTGYIDVQGSASFLMPTPFGFPIPVTVSGGVQFGLHQGPNPHLGGGIGGPPGSWGAGVNFYPDQRISEGLACGFQAGVPLRGPVGAGGEAGFGGISMHFKESLPTFDGTFYRGAGPYIGSPGAAALCSYILPTFPWW